MSSAIFAASSANGGKREPITQSSVQKMLDENTELIRTIIDYQNQGNVRECAQYQQLLHRNLIFLATLADSTLSQQQQYQQPPVVNQQQVASLSNQQQQQQTSQQQQQLHQHYQQQQQALQQNFHQQQQAAMQQHIQQQLLRSNISQNNAPVSLQSSTSVSSPMTNTQTLSLNNVEANKNITTASENTGSGRSTPSDIGSSTAHLMGSNTVASSSEKNIQRSHIPGFSMGNQQQSMSMPNMIGLPSNGASPSPFLMANGMPNGATPEMLQNMFLQQQMARSTHDTSAVFSEGVGMPQNNSMPPSTGF